MEEDNYKTNIEKSINVVKDIQHSLKPNSVGFISIDNLLKAYEELYEYKNKKRWWQFWKKI